MSKSKSKTTKRNRRSPKRLPVALDPMVSRAGLIKTCRMAYQYVLDESAHPMLKEPKRLDVAKQRELGRRLAETWFMTSTANEKVQV